jgi:transcriptional regulator with XRE-family HTH domain
MATRTRKFKRSAKARKFVVAVGAGIKTQRKRGGVTQRTLARKLDTDVPTVSRIESGDRDLRTSELYEVGAALGVPPRVLVDVPLNGSDGEGR